MPEEGIYKQSTWTMFIFAAGTKYVLRPDNTGQEKEKDHT